MLLGSEASLKSVYKQAFINVFMNLKMNSGKDSYVWNCRVCR